MQVMPMTHSATTAEGRFSNFLMMVSGAAYGNLKCFYCVIEICQLLKKLTNLYPVLIN